MNKVKRYTPERKFLVYIFASVSESLVQKEPARTAVSMLPMLLQHGRIFDLPIVIPNCRQLVLRDLIYKNKEEDLITQCKVIVNGIEVTYNRALNRSKTYHINGEQDSEYIINVDPEKDLCVSLEVSCHDFNLCHCKEHRFHLNMLAICD